MDQDKVNILYNAAKHYYDENDVGSIGDFTNYLSDENQRRALYEDLTQNQLQRVLAASLQVDIR